MSLPGLGLVAPPTATTAPITAAASTAVHELNSNSEWRFEVAINGKINVKILSGTAELFGTELAVNHVYSFYGTKAAIFTWHGCRIEVTGSCEEYTAEETPMVSYANTHFALEGLRQEAVRTGREGPRVLIVGPTNAGKTSLAKLLTAYATRGGRQPLVVNTDSREGMLSIPGTLTATVFASIIDVEEGWGSSPTSGPSPVPVKLPLCYYYGLPSPEDNPKLFKPLLTRLGLAATSRMADDPEVKETGMIIDTPGVISQGKGGYDLISHIVSEFSVNVIISLGSERLHSDMVRRFDGHKNPNDDPITVIKLDKSGGCADRDEDYLQQTRQAQIREYFFGDRRRTLSPNTQTVDFNAIKIYKIRESNPLLASFLPGGSEEEEYANANTNGDGDNNMSSSASGSLAGGHGGSSHTPTAPTTQLLHCILAVLHPSPSYDDGRDGDGNQARDHGYAQGYVQDSLRDASVLGFVYVAEVDEKRQRLRVLAPLGGKLGGGGVGGGGVGGAWVWGSWPGAVVGLVG